jgi:hypothetical protein
VFVVQDNPVIAQTSTLARSLLAKMEEFVLKMKFNTAVTIVLARLDILEPIAIF